MIWCHHLQWVTSTMAVGGDEKAHWWFMPMPESSIHYFCLHLHSIGQNPITWPQLFAIKSGKQLPLCLRGAEVNGDHIVSLCHAPWNFIVVSTQCLFRFTLMLSTSLLFLCSCMWYFPSAWSRFFGISLRGCLLAGTSLSFIYLKFAFQFVFVFKRNF